MPVYPKLSPNGLHRAEGFGEITLDGKAIGKGYAPQWKSNDVLVASDGAKVREYHLATSTWHDVYAVDLRNMAAEDNRFAGVTGSNVNVVEANGVVVTIPDSGVVALGASPTSIGHVKGWSSPTPVYVDDVKVSDGPGIEMKGARGVYVWSERWKTFGWRSGTPKVALSPGWEEFWPVPVIGPNNEVWILAHDNNFIYLRKWGATKGIKVGAAPVSYPDVAWNGTKFRVVWGNGTTVRDELVDPTAPLVNLPIPAAPPVEPPIPPIEPPVEPPEPPIIVPPNPEPPVAFPTDAEFADFFNRLNAKYTAPPMSRPVIDPPCHVDAIGMGRWTYDYSLHRQAGDTHEVAWSKVNHAINVIIGEPEPPTPQPPTGDVSIRLNGKFFSRADGQRMTVIESSEFSLFKRYLDHDPLCDTVLAERRDLGFNLLRVWLLNHSVVAFRNGVEQDMIHPGQYVDFYPRLRQFCEHLASYGLCVELTVFTQTQTLMPNQSDQQRHLDRTADAVRGLTNVLLETVNENDQHDNAIAAGLTKPPGVIISHGSNGSDQDGVEPLWDYGLYHTNGLSEWQRKVGHNAMELAEQADIPYLSNENTRYPDNEDSALHAYDAMAGAALLCAGACYHSQGGKFSRPFDGVERTCAAQWVAGANSVPVEFQPGRYARHDDMNSPTVIRAYSRTLPDGRAHLVKIRK